MVSPVATSGLSSRLKYHVSRKLISAIAAIVSTDTPFQPAA